MSWRSVFIGRPARLSATDRQLVIAQEETVTVPLEDIGAIVVEDRRVTVTAALLALLGSYKIPVFFCDDKHLPCALLQPFHQHSRQKKLLLAQIAASKPFVKNCWQKIIRQKINNQAEALRLAGCDGYEELRLLSGEVSSGDSGGKEAQAAKLYFARLFPASSRQADTVANAALNYGYAILRGATARALAAYGLQPALGLWHSGELNPFNLADDMLEPFRPVVDLWVVENCREGEGFSLTMRQGLVALLHRDVLLQDKRQAVLRAIDLACAQLAAAYLAKEPARLLLPALLPLHIHEYT